MDELTKELQSFLVRMGYQPESVAHETEHAMEHIIALLGPNDEDSLTDYFGLFGKERLSLDEIASRQKLSPEEMMERIDRCLRRLAVTPEWQLVRNNIETTYDR